MASAMPLRCQFDSGPAGTSASLPTLGLWARFDRGAGILDFADIVLQNTPHQLSNSRKIQKTNDRKFAITALTRLSPIPLSIPESGSGASTKPLSACPQLVIADNI